MKKYQLRNIDCAACAADIERGLSNLPEVQSVAVNFATATLHIETDSIEKVKARVKEIEPAVQIIEVPDDVKGHAPQTSRPAFSWNELGVNKTELRRIGLVVALLALGMIYEDLLRTTPYRSAEFAVLLTAYLISGWKVIRSAVKNIVKGKVFDEHFLMTVATVGAITINQMPEAVAVMLFYVVGEFFQDIALRRSRRSIKSLLEIKPDYANLKENGTTRRVHPTEIRPGQRIVVKPSEKIPLDGTILEGNSFVDTSALTGEFVPRSVKPNEQVLAGMINKSGLLTISVTKPFGESSIAKILDLVENASSKKAETEKLITTFARTYTPVVVFGAVLLAVLPPLFFADATFSDWIYRALVVLVISCPCALVISIPLGYFGGIGGASHRGILVKGSSYLDALTKVKTIVFDKTGTLTKGEFKVADIITHNGFSRDELLMYAAHAESHSSHPIAKSIIEAYRNNVDESSVGNVEEVGGKGIKASVAGKQIIIGNDKLLHLEDIQHDKCDVEGTVVHIAVDSLYAGYVVIADSLKDDACETIRLLKERSIESVMLTGDNRTAAETVAKQLGISTYYYALMPEEKVKHIEHIIRQTPRGSKVGFVGDGINDAPVIARADVGFAMGALGSDVAIETADVVLMTDAPSKVVTAIDVAAKTRKIVWQNIGFTMAVKFLFILLGAFGIATMWEAVFGDMGVAIVAILNAMRVLK
jgi:Cd2+/Zn2+-exporting ATPase